MTLQVVGALSVGVAHKAVATLMNMTREIENTVVPTTRTFMCRHRIEKKASSNFFARGVMSYLRTVQLAGAKFPLGIEWWQCHW